MTTTNLGMTLPTVGGDADAWGGELNTNLGLIDAYLAPGQYKGTATNDSAASGYVGEFLETILLQPSAISLSNNTAKTIVSRSLTAGDWDVSFVPYIGFGTATSTGVIGSVSLVNDTIDFTVGRATRLNPAITTTSTTISAGVPPRRISLASTTTIYGVVQVTFSAGTAEGYGHISARRVR